MRQTPKEPAMFSVDSRPVRLALLAGLIVLSGSSAEAGNFGANFSVLRSTQDFRQTETTARRTDPVFGTAVTPPPPVYQGGGGPRPRGHTFDPNAQFDGSGTGNSASGLPK
jgi:hypothetical protein